MKSLASNDSQIPKSGRVQIELRKVVAITPFLFLSGLFSGIAIMIALY